MGEVDYFLATAFNWLHHNDDNIFVHSSQSAFIRHTALHFCVDDHNKVPDMTPYCSGLSIEDIPQPDKNDADLKRRTKLYQSIIDYINWLAKCTQPETWFHPHPYTHCLYQNLPNQQHYNDAIFSIKYLTSTS